MFNNQNNKKVMAGPVSNPTQAGKTDGMLPKDGNHTLHIWKIAEPPIQVCMPNQPHATMARKMAGIFAPFTPKLARANTGNGMPYFAPACPFNTIGTSTMVLPKKMVNMACHQFMPPSINELASM